MATTKNKGDILEQVVAWLHATPGVVVQRSVRLPMIGSERRRREIDVLLTSYVSGHEVRLAVECKNEGGPVGSPKIDRFRDKLEAIGIPTSLGIYVSVNGYTEGAMEAARAAGIKTLMFHGLSADRLAFEITEAFQSVVVLLPEVTGVNLVNDLTESISRAGGMFLFYDEEGEPAGTVPDFVWEAWLTGQLPPRIGTTALELKIPAGWHHVIAKQRQDIRAIGVTIKIVAMVMTLEGEASQSTLVGAEDGQILQRGIKAEFTSPVGEYQLRAFESEYELNDYFASRGLLHVSHRIQSPRIQFWNMMFWPPSQRVADVIAERMAAFGRGEIPDPRPFSFEQIEGTDLGAAWEPVADQYMAAWRKR